MNFQIAAQGRSFKGAMAYYTHDKRAPSPEGGVAAAREGAGPHPASSERVAWTETRNIASDRPEVATRIMIATAERADQLKAEAGIAATGRKAQKPVLAYSLAWHPTEAGKLDRAEMSRAANDSLRVLGLEKHQAVIVAHRDTAHPHVHVIVNRVSPEDGRMAKIDPARVRALDRWANEYEKARGQVVSPERAAKYERVAEKQRQYPDPEARRAHVAEKAAGRAQAARERQEAASGASGLPEARKAAQGASERPQSQAAILREISAATKERHRQEWVALRGGYAAQKAEIASAHKGKTREVLAAHKRDTKPDWAAQFRGERDGARERQRMERGLIGRLSLSIAAAREQHREQGGSFAKLVAVNFLSKERREGAFAAASQRDRAALSARLNRELGGKLEPLKAGRAFEMGQALERFKEDRSDLVDRQAGEWGKIREAWKQVGREKAPERGRGSVQESGREGEAQQGSRFGWLDRQKAERNVPARGVAEPRQQAEQAQNDRKASRFDWLNRKKNIPTKFLEPDKHKKDRNQSDRDR
ncbi:relaxase/mobilization nuclease domain-containing protein [Paracoccus sediminilitoris]|uniref:relaxase/mobilization nuclease domain-containing protein n=1 Tax=Paracoccus sediminilitoris TaxID=2202419 RepID=UPI000DBA3B98|nr:relaxase/mobilization nuclease domain-containing protein [Paracoccus sediminilitoris]